MIREMRFTHLLTAKILAILAEDDNCNSLNDNILANARRWPAELSR